uniref:Peptidase S1 domain-containing protein n=1 Tax=Anopheles minimus TaxID=112268 RepID=A0A182W2F7_9DIPT
MNTMKQVIGLVILGLFCSNAVLAENNDDQQPQGVSQSGRIINGIDAKIENHKYTLFLRIGSEHCAAVIITASHALTAGHCVYTVGDDISKVILYGGSTFSKPNGTPIPVLKVAVHPDYKGPDEYDGRDFDIAVLTVAKNAFKGKQNMARIALQTSELPLYTRCFVVGWGRTDFKVQRASKDLRYTDMEITPLDICIAVWKKYRKVSDNTICALNKKGADTCRGDSGGPFVCGGKLTGITSFSHRFCTGEWPAGFVKIMAPSISSFIESQTKA